MQEYREETLARKFAELQVSDGRGGYRPDETKQKIEAAYLEGWYAALKYAGQLIKQP